MDHSNILARLHRMLVVVLTDNTMTRVEVLDANQRSSEVHD